jgi:hypothetical protein
LIVPLPVPNSYDELMDVQHIAAVNVIGADHSSWNGVVLPDDPVSTKEGETTLGIATWDHEIGYNDELVKKPLREMYLRRGQVLDDATVLRIRTALDVMFHENLHLLAAKGTDHRDAKGAFQNLPGVKAFEEGATALGSHIFLDDYIDELQLLRICPQLKTVVGQLFYPKYSPATQAFTAELGTISELGHNEVLRQVNAVNAAGKFPIATDIVMRKHGLHDLVPWGRIKFVRDDIEIAMLSQFARLETLDAKPANTLRARSREIGRRAFDEGSQVAFEIREQYLRIGGFWQPLAPRSLDAGNRGERRSGWKPNLRRGRGTER